jgi:UDP-glucose:(heptosyl)LPS alpha-1,3-glucosyltransferase
MMRGESFLKVLTFALSARGCVAGLRKEFDVVVGFDRTLDMDIYRAGNACHRAWLERRRLMDGPMGRLSVLFNPLHRIINRIERKIFLDEGNRTIVVLSHQGRRQIQRFYPVPDERFVVIPPGVDFSRFPGARRSARRNEVRPRLGLPTNAPVLLHVGSGFRIKALDVTIRCLAKLAPPGDRAVLLVAGKGNRRPYEALARRLNVSERVRFLGPVSDPADLYAAADLFVLPTLFDTFGVVVLEAMACGLPVVVGTGAGVAEWVMEQDCGRVVSSPVCPDDLAETIACLIEDPAEMGRLAENGQRAAGLLTVERSTADFLGVMDRIAEGRSHERRMEHTPHGSLRGWSTRGALQVKCQ